MTTKTVLFIHGNFVNYNCWDGWVERYEAKGYTCIATAYPGRDHSVEELRAAHPDSKLAQLSLIDVIDYLVPIIKELDEPPIIIGHSFGGLLTQLMVTRGLGAAAVAIDSVPPMGVLSLELSFFRSTLPIFNPFTASPWLMPFDHFQYTFTNGMPLEEQQAAYDQYIAPESLRLCRGGLGFNATVDFKKERCPLLLIAGEIDHIMPASLNKMNYNRYKSSPSVTDFQQFSGRNHFSIIGGEGWEEVADYALAWAEKAIS